MFKVSHQIINEKTVQVHCILHCILVFFMIALKHTAQPRTENDLFTAESQLVNFTLLTRSGRRDTEKQFDWNHQRDESLAIGHWTLGPSLLDQF